MLVAVECRSLWRARGVSLMAWPSGLVTVALLAVVLWALFLLMVIHSCMTPSRGTAIQPQPHHPASASPSVASAPSLAETPASLLLGVFSMAANVKERAAFRNSLAAQPASVAVSMTLRFVLGDFDWSATLGRENATHGDLLVLRNMAENMNDGKSFLFFAHAAATLHFDFIAKCDLDTRLVRHALHCHYPFCNNCLAECGRSRGRVAVHAAPALLRRPAAVAFRLRGRGLLPARSRVHGWPVLRAVDGFGALRGGASGAWRPLHCWPA